jgi:hypothetical protein
MRHYPFKKSDADYEAAYKAAYKAAMEANAADRIVPGDTTYPAAVRYGTAQGSVKAYMDAYEIYKEQLAVSDLTHRQMYAIIAQSSEMDWEDRELAYSEADNTHETRSLEAYKALSVAWNRYCAVRDFGKQQQTQIANQNE